MALTNAEKQAAFRDRQALQHAERDKRAGRMRAALQSIIAKLHDSEDEMDRKILKIALDCLV